MRFDVSRAGEPHTLNLRPDSVAQRDPVTGRRRYIGQIGTTPRIPDERAPLTIAQSVAAGWRATWRTAGEVIATVKGLVTRDVALNQLGGPIAIARASVTAARTGFAELMFLVALLSINVAILNLLPIPILDGGQIVLNVVEAARGVSFSLRTREYIMRFGLLAIALLFVLVMFNDIRREIQTLLQRFG
jgi:regulator of sigma E protease